MDHDPIKQCYDPHLLKKRRTSQPASVDAAAGIGAGASRSNSLLSAPKDSEQRSPLRGKENVVPSNTSEVNSGRFLAEAIQKSVEEDNVPDRLDNIFPVEGEDGQGSLQLSLGEAQPAVPIAQGQTGMELLSAARPIEAQ